MKPPTAFIPTPSAPFPAPRPEPQRARVVDTAGPARPVLPRVVPTLTVYADGLVNLNGDATRALGTAAAIMLLPPTTPGTRWQLLPRKTTAGALVLAGRTDRVGFARFRSAALAAALYAALPVGFPGPLYLELLPSAEAGFDLVAQPCATIPAP